MAKLKDESKCYDWFSVGLHWLIALLVIGLFISGVWMVGLDYYHEWYYRAPWWHKSLGMVVLVLILTRFIWVTLRLSPEPLMSIPGWQVRIASLVHGLMNFLLILIAVSGYLMVTAKGDNLSIFDWFAIPALFSNRAGWVDPAGTIHLWLAYTVITLAVVHALAAIKHHFIDKDATLWRMFGIRRGNKL